MENGHWGEWTRGHDPGLLRGGSMRSKWLPKGEACKSQVWSCGYWCKPGGPDVTSHLLQSRVLRNASWPKEKCGKAISHSSLTPNSGQGSGAHWQMTIFVSVELTLPYLCGGGGGTFWCRHWLCSLELCLWRLSLQHSEQEEATSSQTLCRHIHWCITSS